MDVVRQPLLRETVPVRLEVDPIIEAACEIRFVPVSNSSSELIPGQIFSAVKGYVNSVEDLNLATVPAEVAAREPSLWHQARRRLAGEHYSIAIGPRSLAISRNFPYCGWSEFRETIDTTLSALKDTEQLSRVDRLSIKYRNILEAPDDIDHFDLLTANLALANFDFSNKSAQVRAETTLDRFQNIINLQTRTTVSSQEHEFERFGLLFDVDTLYLDGFNDFWSEYDSVLEDAHMTEKRVFFDLLTDETLARYKPVWE